MQLERLSSSDVDKGDDDALNHIGYRAVRHDPYGKPLTIRGFDLILAEHQCAQSLLGVGLQSRINEGAGQLAERPPDIRFTQVHDVGYVVGESTYVQGIVEKQSRDVGAVQEVLHITLRQRQISKLRMQLGVD